jgi:hypothetical protein
MFRNAEIVVLRPEVMELRRQVPLPPKSVS